MTRAFGWRPEHKPATLRAYDHAQRLGLGIAPSESWIMMDSVAALGISEQGYTPSCVAQAISKAASIRQHMAGGEPVSVPSRRWLHLYSRLRDDGFLSDGGTFISTACAVMREVGWPDEEHLPWSDAWALTPDDIERNRWVDEMPGPTTRRHASDQRGAVQEYGVENDEETRACLSAGLPIVFGSEVDEGWRRLKGWDPYTFTGPSIGGHAQVAVGYSTAGVGVLNSHGAQYGEGGLWLCSWQCWRQQCRDRRAILECERATT